MLGKWPIPNKLSRKVAPAGGLWIRRVPGSPPVAFGSGPGGATESAASDCLVWRFAYLRRASERPEYSVFADAFEQDSTARTMCWKAMRILLKSWRLLNAQIWFEYPVRGP
jgi:hypothetical protein